MVGAYRFLNLCFIPERCKSDIFFFTVGLNALVPIFSLLLYCVPLLILHFAMVLDEGIFVCRPKVRGCLACIMNGHKMGTIGVASEKSTCRQPQQSGP